VEGEDGSRQRLVLEDRGSRTDKTGGSRVVSLCQRRAVGHTVGSQQDESKCRVLEIKTLRCLVPSCCVRCSGVGLLVWLLPSGIHPNTFWELACFELSNASKLASKLITLYMFPITSHPFAASQHLGESVGRCQLIVARCEPCSALGRLCDGVLETSGQVRDKGVLHQHRCELLKTQTP
jgi:hypothetical protein